jgi:hypothetical protein
MGEILEIQDLRISGFEDLRISGSQDFRIGIERLEDFGFASFG